MSSDAEKTPEQVTPKTPTEIAPTTFPIKASELQAIFDRIVKGFIAGDPALTLIQEIGNRKPLA